MAVGTPDGFDFDPSGRRLHTLGKTVGAADWRWTVGTAVGLSPDGELVGGLLFGSSTSSESMVGRTVGAADKRWAAGTTVGLAVIVKDVGTVVGFGLDDSFAVCAALGRKVGEAVGSPVRCTVGVVVGMVVGFTVGVYVGFFVGALVGVEEGVDVAAAVGVDVGAADG